VESLGFGGWEMVEAAETPAGDESWAERTAHADDAEGRDVLVP
jgi:hypothetical protein